MGGTGTLALATQCLLVSLKDTMELLWKPRTTGGREASLSITRALEIELKSSGLGGKHLSLPVEPASQPRH